MQMAAADDYFQKILGEIKGDRSNGAKRYKVAKSQKSLDGSRPLKKLQAGAFRKKTGPGDVAIPSCRRWSARTARKLGVRRVGSEILGQHSHVVVIEHARIELRHGRQNGRQETVVATSRASRRSP
jgi:hypothetical protein